MLKQLQVEYKTALSQKRKYEEQLELNRIKMENLKATQYDKEIVGGSSQGIDINDLLDKQRVLELELGYAKENIGILEAQILELEKTFKELNDRTQLIYLQRFIKGWSITKISMLNGISEPTVYRELKEIKERI